MHTKNGNATTNDHSLGSGGTAVGDIRSGGDEAPDATRVQGCDLRWHQRCLGKCLERYTRGGSAGWGRDVEPSVRAGPRVGQTDAYSCFSLIAPFPLCLVKVRPAGSRPRVAMPGGRSRIPPATHANTSKPQSLVDAACWFVYCMGDVRKLTILA